MSIEACQTIGWSQMKIRRSRTFGDIVEISYLAEGIDRYCEHFETEKGAKLKLQNIIIGILADCKNEGKKCTASKIEIHKYRSSFWKMVLYYLTLGMASNQ